MTPTIAYSRGLRVPEPAAAPVATATAGRRAVTLRVAALVSADVAAIALMVAVVVALSATTPLRAVPLAAVLLATWLVASRAVGLNAMRAAHRESTAEEIRIVVATAAITVLVTSTAGQHDRLESVMPLGAWAAVLIAAIVGVRALARTVCARRAATRVRTLVLGHGVVGDVVLRRANIGAAGGIQLVGTVGEPGVDTTLPYLGTLDDAVETARAHDVQHVIVAPGGEAGEELWDAVDALVCAGIRVDIAAPRGATVDGVLSVAGVPFAHVASHDFSRLGRTLKRGLDIAGSLALLVVLSPLLVLTALAIRLDSPGGVLFRQRRVGLDGSPFTVLKFRSMGDEAHAARAALLEDHGHLTGDDRMFKMADDPRVTRVGRFIRRTSIDELPQLVNVLRGDMSLVGPRPLIPEEDRFVEGRGRHRLMLKPGLTGPWQILGRSEIPFGEMVELDCGYVAGWTPLRDVQLLLRTAPALLRGSGAY